MIAYKNSTVKFETNQFIRFKAKTALAIDYVSLLFPEE